jgi:hypothetical protein
MLRATAKSTVEILMNRPTPPFRADHVGSLLRTREGPQTRDDRQHDRISDAQLRAVEDAEIHKVAKMQEDLGCAASPTANIDAARGMWTFFTRWVASLRLMTPESDLSQREV